VGITERRIRDALRTVPERHVVRVDLADAVTALAGD
jgi:hypothetical protein